MMKKTIAILKRYSAFLILLVINVIIGLIVPNFAVSSFSITKKTILEMLGVIPPIFILLGLLDVWVQRETMMKYLGKGSGLKGVLIAFLLGSVAAGPLYGAFPVATVMLKKGAGLFYVFIFIGAWSTTKIPLVTFEASSLGVGFAITRLLLNLVGIIIIAIVTDKSLSQKQKEEVYEIANSNDK